MWINIVLAFIALLMVIEGTILAANPKFGKSITMRMLKKPQTIRTVGFIELLFGLVILLASVASQLG